MNKSARMTKQNKTPTVFASRIKIGLFLTRKAMLAKNVSKVKPLDKRCILMHFEQTQIKIRKLMAVFKISILLLTISSMNF